MYLPLFLISSRSFAQSFVLILTDHLQNMRVLFTVCLIQILTPSLGSCFAPVKFNLSLHRSFSAGVTEAIEQFAV